MSDIMLGYGRFAERNFVPEAEKAKPKSAWTKIGDALPPEDETGERFVRVRMRGRELLLARPHRYGGDLFWIDQNGELWAWEDGEEWAPIPE